MEETSGSDDEGRRVAVGARAPKPSSYRSSLGEAQLQRCCQPRMEMSCQLKVCVEDSEGDGATCQHGPIFDTLEPDRPRCETRSY